MGHIFLCAVEVLQGKFSLYLHLDSVEQGLGAIDQGIVVSIAQSIQKIVQDLVFNHLGRQGRPTRIQQTADRFPMQPDKLNAGVIGPGFARRYRHARLHRFGNRMNEFKQL
ncbi:MAG: hypothetical protein QNI97_09885 [Desulfobacterales bacterium]|nr:hypothetical protein [Desulfobacterales bacterium]MDJ0988520.1 hypothetical protein [Desulfobacterales bacterium]